MKKNIGIIELEEHFEFVHTLSRIIYSDEYSITVFTTESIHENLKKIMKNRYNNYKFVIDCDQNIKNFLKKVEKICNEKIDLVFFLSMQASVWNMPYYKKFNPKCKMVLGTARYEEWFGAKYHFFPNRLNLIKNIQHYFRKRILPKYDSVLFHSQAESDYIAEKYSPKQYIMTIPFALYENDRGIKKSNSKITNFTIVGAVEEKRRDYLFLLNIIEQLPIECKDSFSLKLLGKPVGDYGNKVLKYAEKLKNKGYDIVYYSEFVPIEEYENSVINTDVLISPTKEDYYTLEGWTAAVVDAIRFNKVIIFPKNYLPLKEILEISYFYSNKESLKKLLVDFISNKKLFINQSGMELLKKKYSEEEWRPKIHNDISRILNS